MSSSHFLPANWGRKSILLAAPGILFIAAAPAFAHHIEKHFKVDPHAVITIHNPNGKVVVKAWTKSEVMVIADHSSTNVEVDAQQIGNRIDVITHQVPESIAPDDLRADYQINVPQDAELQIHNDSGEVSVSDVLGDMNVETVGAGVNLEDAAGYLTVKTIGGSFVCMSCAGRIEVSSISGSFKFLNLRSYFVRAQTSKGNIVFDGEFLPSGTYRLKNYSGLIEVHFSPGDSFDLSATSLKGKVNNQAKLSPPSHPPHFYAKYSNSLFGTLNAGRAKVDLASYDGTINIVKRD
jgi:DUF4097 and DUF4098 domain-containing protein YvlB